LLRAQGVLEAQWRGALAAARRASNERVEASWRGSAFPGHSCGFVDVSLSRRSRNDTLQKEQIGPYRRVQDSRCSGSESAKKAAISRIAAREPALMPRRRAQICYY
jgi:hypothetical protein